MLLSGSTMQLYKRLLPTVVLTHGSASAKEHPSALMQRVCTCVAPFLYIAGYGSPEEEVCVEQFPSTRRFVPEECGGSPMGCSTTKQQHSRPVCEVQIADEGFDGVHQESVILDNLPKEKILGKLSAEEAQASAETDTFEPPPIDSILNLYDLEQVLNMSYLTAACSALLLPPTLHMLPQLFFR
jgi:hypothetical protein